jgi:mgtE-like transporter
MGFITFYEKRGKKHLIAKRIIKESFLVLLLCVVLDIIAGAVIGAKIESFIAVAGLLTVIPSFLEDGGAIGGVLSSRFGSLLHLGILQPKIKPPKEILKIFGIFHLMGLFIFALIALLAQGMNILMGIETIPTVKLVAVTVLAGQILLVPLNFMAYYFSIVSFRRGIDPDNVGIPLITSMMDVFGTVCFLLALILFGIV